MNWSKHTLLTLLVLYSCNVNELDFDKVELQELSPQIAVPLGSFEYTMKELVEELDNGSITIGTDSDQLIILSFEDSASYKLSSDFVDIGEVDGDGIIAPEITAVAADEPIIIPFEKEFIYTYDRDLDERLDSVFYDDGNITLRVISSCECDYTYEFIINNTRTVATDEPVNLAGGVIFDGTSSLVDERTQNLRGYKTSLASGENIFTSIFRGQIIVNPGQRLRFEDQLEFEFLYKDQDFDKVFGFFGQDTVSISAGDITIDLFENAISEGIIFEGPRIRFDFDNKFGIPIAILSDSIYGKNNQEDSVFLSGSFPDNPQLVDFNRTDFFAGQETRLEIGPENSNIRTLFELAPDFIKFPITGISNFGNSSGFNYITDESGIDSKLTFTLPMKFRLEDFRQKIEFDIEGSIDVEELDSLFLQLVTRNNLPFNIEMSISILDAEQNSLYQTPETTVVEPPIYNAMGRIARDSKSISNFQLGKVGVEALRNGTTLRVDILLNSPTRQVNDFFDILITNGIQANIAVGGTVKFKL